MYDISFLTEEQEQDIENHFDRLSLNRAKKCVELYKEKWQLSEIKLIEFYSANLLFDCFCSINGHAVLKIHMGINDIGREVLALKLLESRQACRVYRFSEDDKVCLLEKISPGESLFNIESRRERVHLFCEVYFQLHKMQTKTNLFPTYLECIDESQRAISGRKDCVPILRYLTKARKLVVSICKIYSKTLLLHGDLHHENILRNQSGRYTIIDPLGYIGDPVFDISRFVIVEFQDLVNQPVKDVVSLLQMLSVKTAIPVKTLKECLFIETVIRLFYEELRRGQALSDHKHLLSSVESAEKIVYAS